MGILQLSEPFEKRHNLYFWDNVNNTKSYCDFFDTINLSKDTFDHYSSWSLFEYKLMLALFMNCLLRFKTKHQRIHPSNKEKRPRYGH